MYVYIYIYIYVYIYIYLSAFNHAILTVSSLRHLRVLRCKNMAILKMCVK